MLYGYSTDYNSLINPKYLYLSTLLHVVYRNRKMSFLEAEFCFQNFQTDRGEYVIPFCLRAPMFLSDYDRSRVAIVFKVIVARSKRQASGINFR